MRITMMIDAGNNGLMMVMGVGDGHDDSDSSNDDCNNNECKIYG